jgi:DNA-binding NarL/FixJ family response regulator
VSDLSQPALTRIAVVDDHPVFREGTAALLQREPDFDVVALGASADDAVAIANATDAPDVLLLDVRLGDDSGLRVLESLARRTAVVIVTAYDYPEYVRAALDAGAAGFVVKGAATSELVSTIRMAAAGALAFARRPDGAALRLSAREIDVVRLVTDGLSNDEIGQRLGITTKAVEGHLSRVFARTGARSRTELAVRAVREGWADLPGS